MRNRKIRFGKRCGAGETEQADATSRNKRENARMGARWDSRTGMETVTEWDYCCGL